ncbi:hypothetical protein [Streptomyces sp. NPDC058657]|uniref:hypothetical protein n=1 Tax=unclassified Streptomyces TaxID=2593676 RepID=UPI0036694741
MSNVPPSPEPIPGAAEKSIDLTGLTPYTVGIIRLAEAKGLRPTWAPPYGNARRIILNAEGPHGTFGSITVGRKSGKVLRTELIRGNDGRPYGAKGTNNVRHLINGVPVSACQPGCDAFSTADCRA